MESALKITISRSETEIVEILKWCCESLEHPWRTIDNHKNPRTVLAKSYKEWKPYLLIIDNSNLNEDMCLCNFDMRKTDVLKFKLVWGS